MCVGVGVGGCMCWEEMDEWVDVWVDVWVDQLPPHREQKGAFVVVLPCRGVGDAIDTVWSHCAVYLPGERILAWKVGEQVWDSVQTVL